MIDKELQNVGYNERKVFLAWRKQTQQTSFHDFMIFNNVEWRTSLK